MFPMQIDSEALRRHYASLSDEELLTIEPAQLTAMARDCYEREMEARKLAAAPGSQSGEMTEEAEVLIEVDPNWPETAATACSYQLAGGSGPAEMACSVLEAAGIPCEIVQETDESGVELLSVAVPGWLSLHAASVLDRDLFNDELEETWRTHFDHLSDEEISALDPDDLCAGLLDRAARLRRVYEESMARRQG
jgi:hypothetical protein